MKKSPADMTLFLGSAPTAEAQTAIRTSAQTICTCIASMLDYLEEPLKAKFLEVKDKINVMLAGLPATDAVPAALESNNVLQHLLSVMGYAQSMMTNLTEAAKASGAKAQRTLASLPEEIQKEIDARIAKGELFAKADHDKAVTDATVAARTKFEADAKAIAARRTSLNNLPVPTDDFLTGEEKDFAARQQRATKRVEDLKPFKAITGERLITLCWKLEDDAYADALALIKEVGSGSSTGKPNGFVTPNGGIEPPKKLKATAGAI